MSSDHKRTSARRDRVGHVMSLIRANADQSDRLDQLGSSIFGLNRTDGRSVELLSRLGPMTPKELARHLGMSTGGVTTVIDRLEKAGYVRRRHDTKDRRRLLLETTERHAAVEREIFGGLVAATLRVVSSYSESDLQLIGRFLEQVGATVAAHNDQLEKRKRGRRVGRRPRHSAAT